MNTDDRIQQDRAQIQSQQPTPRQDLNYLLDNETPNSSPITDNSGLTLVYILALGVVIALYRVFPYYFLNPYQGLPWNLAPMGALALFVGSRLRTRYDMLVPLTTMLVADLLLIYPLAQMGYPSITWGTPLIYASFAVYVYLGRLIRRNELAPWKVGVVALVASVQFFLLTNFAVWLTEPTHPKTLAGLLNVYALGLPFYRNTLLGDLFFSLLFFPAHAALTHLAVAVKVRQPA